MKSAPTRRHSNLRPKHKHTKDYLKHYYPFLPLLLSIGVLLTVITNPIIGGRHKSVLAYSTNVTQSTLLDDTNAERSKNGVISLSSSTLLAQAAQTKANDMIARDYWSHTTPEGNQPWTFVAGVGYNYEKAGENLAFGFDSSAEVIKGWMNSPTHRANMLDNVFTEVGFGTANSTDFNGNGPSTVVVAMYATPSTTSASGLSSTNNDSNSSQGILNSNAAINRIELLTQSAWVTYLIALALGAAIMYLVVTHSIGIKRGFRKGEKFVIHHPLLDSIVILSVAGGILLLEHAGYIL